MDDKCIKILETVKPYQGVFQSFNNLDEGDATPYHIIECYNSTDVKTLIMIDEKNAPTMGTCYGIDYILYNIVANSNKEFKSSMLDIYFNVFNRPLYTDKLNLKGGTLKPNYVFVQFKNHLSTNKKTNINHLCVQILMFQIYWMLSNLSKFYPKTFAKNMVNSMSLIYKLVANTPTIADNNGDLSGLHNLMTETLLKSEGFISYHDKTDIKTILADTENKLTPINIKKTGSNYVKLLGLYICYQIYKNDEGKAEPNKPFYPTISGKIIPYVTGGAIGMSDSKSDIIKMPFKPELSINTFIVPEDIKFEVNVTKLSDVTDENKYEPMTNLITLEEITALGSDDSFIYELVKSEIQLMYYKLATYNKMDADISKNLTNNVDDKVVKMLKKKQSYIKVSLKIINKRVAEINGKLKSEQINYKRESFKHILNDADNGILSIKGTSRENIRRYLYSQIYIFSKAPELFVKNFMNYTLMGPAGSGKTKVAGVIAYVYNNLGILASSNPNGKFMVATASDLIASYIGHTAPLTRDVLEKMMEGVLLIDEAYQVSGCPSSSDSSGSGPSFAAEAIAEIVNYIDKHIGLSVIIAAGYEDKMTKCFLGSNEGMKRRFPNNIRLLNYTPSDLYDILMNFVYGKFKSNIFTESQRLYIKSLIDGFSKEKYEGELLFSNQAGDMLNLSTSLLEDLIFLAPTGYVASDINTTFQKFFANKGIYIDFGGQSGGGAMCKINNNDDISHTYNNIRDLQRGMYKLLV